MSIQDNTYNRSLNHFCIAGINYRKSDTNIRSKFSLTPEQSVILLKQSALNKITGCLALSTCNRTELYGISNDPNELAQLLCDNTENSLDDFIKQGYIYRGIPAIEHLFKVASGLDSQIIGDYEILSQLKHSAKIAKECGSFNSFMERAINYALQVSKEIKTKTKLSSGTVSVSYAAIEIIKEKIKDLNNKRVLLVGTGKFGNHIAQNLQDYLPGAVISFANRTNEKASELAKQYGAEFISYENLPSAANESDVIIVSSAAKNYTILPSFFNPGKSHLLLDLSVPQNIDPDVKNISGITLLNVDEVSQILDKTIALRQAEVPKALKIIDETLNSLESWHQQQFNNPFLRIVKSKLFELNEVYFSENNNLEKVHKTMSALAIQLKHENNKGCQCISALNSYLEMNYETSG
jgi:glutamyl-tRNA reductase